MSGLAITAAPGAQPDWLARLIAIAGVLLAAMSLTQTRYLWRREGPVLAFDLWIIAFQVPGTDVVHRVQARIEVINVGRMAATVRRVELRGPWSPSYIETDITENETPVLQPVGFLVSNGIDFLAPDNVVQTELRREPSPDIFADEIRTTLRVKDETLVRGRVRRGDDKPFTNARKTTIVYQDEPWPGSKASN